jgi:hypothetical protein
MHHTETPVRVSLQELQKTRGPRGGLSLHYGEGSKSILSAEVLKGGSVETGIIRTNKNNHLTMTGFPPMTVIPKQLIFIEKKKQNTITDKYKAAYENSKKQKTVTNKHKAIYENSKKRLEHIEKLIEQFPEYSL